MAQMPYRLWHPRSISQVCGEDDIVAGQQGSLDIGRRIIQASPGQAPFRKRSFQIVNDVSVAEIDLVVSSTRAEPIRHDSFGAGVQADTGPIASSSITVVSQTDLSIRMLHRERGIVYESHYGRPGHPNHMMRYVAEHMMVRYANGL